MTWASQAYSHQSWLQRIIQEKYPSRFCKQFFFFFTGLIILIFGIAMAAFSLDRKTFSLALIATVTVFLIAIGVVAFDADWQSKKVTTPQVEESWRYRIEQVKV